MKNIRFSTIIFLIFFASCQSEKNNNSDRRVGIVKVGGKEYLVKEKDVVAEVTILSINKNEVNVRFQKESKTITK